MARDFGCPPLDLLGVKEAPLWGLTFNYTCWRAMRAAMEKGKKQQDADARKWMHRQQNSAQRAYRRSWGGRGYQPPTRRRR